VAASNLEMFIVIDSLVGVGVGEGSMVDAGAKGATIGV
jgi:hypothetical protein